MEKLSQNLVNKVLNEAVSRERFKYKCTDILMYCLRCIFLRSNKSLKELAHSSKGLKQQLLFRRAQKRLNHELDIKTLIKTVRTFRLVNQSILGQQQRFLLKYQKNHQLETGSESEDSESDHEIAHEVLIESEDPFIRIAALARMKKIIYDFQGKELKPIDRQLFRGIYQSRLNDFEEK